MKDKKVFKGLNRKRGRKIMFLVPREGLEPPIHGSEDRCSIQLSHRGVKRENTLYKIPEKRSLSTKD